MSLILIYLDKYKNLIIFIGLSYLNEEKSK